MRKSWFLAVSVAVAAVAWVGSGQLLKSEGLPPEDVAGAGERAPAMSVRVQRLSAEPMTNRLTLQGRTDAARTVSVRAEVRGLVEEVLVEKGRRVAAGEPLIRIDSGDRVARVDSARALVAQRQIEFNAASQLNARGYSADTTRASARANLDAAIADLSLAELELGRTVIAAPFDGIVDDRMVEVGDYLDSGDAIAQVIDLDPIKVIGQISERYLGQIRIGAPAEITTIDGTHRSGTVSFVANQADATTRTFSVEVSVPNANGEIISGITAELALPIDEVWAHRVSPAFLTLSDDGQLGLKTIDADNHVRFVPVRILGDSPQGIWLGGLPAELDVITVGHEFVLPGQLVAPVRVNVAETGTPKA